jgi:hypothetical protein
MSEMKPEPAPAAPAATEGRASWLDRRLAEIGADVDRIVADMPESRLEAQKLATGVLGMTPSAEMLHALGLLADENVAFELRDGPARKLVLMRLLVDLELHALTEPVVLDLEALETATGTIPELIHRVKEFQRSTDWDPDSLGPRDRERLAKLKKGLMPDIHHLQGFAVLVPRVAHLARAAESGRLEEVPYLSPQDVEHFRAAVPGAGGDGTPPNRICLDASALRWAIQEDLNAWDRIRPQQMEETEEDDADKEEEAGFFGAQDLRLAILEHLKLDVNAYHVLMKRMQHQQDEARSKGADQVVQETSAAQRELFTTYLELTATVRNPAGKAAIEDDEATFAARERLLQEIQEVEEAGMAPSEETKEEVLLEALTAMRANRGKEAAIPKASKSAAKRERLRRNILIGVAAVLAVIAVAVNLTVMLQDNRGAPEPIQVKPSEFTSAMPVNDVVAMGPMMFSEVPAWSWEGMSGEQRMRSLQSLGRLAEQKGFLGVFVVDDQKRELASWTSRSGARLLKTHRPAAAAATP